MIEAGDRPRAAACVVGLALALCPVPASADTNPAAAQTLFDAAEGLMSQGKAEEACQRYEESLRLDPAGSTAMRLGDCLSATGKLARGWARYQLALQLARQKGREDKASEVEKKIAEVEARLAWVTVEVPTGAARPPGLQVYLDGEEQREGAWGVAQPIDPGEHRLERRVRGRQQAARSWVWKEGERRTISLADLALQPLSSAEGLLALISVAPPPARTLPARTTALSVSLGAAGLVALALGAYLAVDATRLSAEAQRSCFPTCQSAGGLALHQQSLSRQRWAGVSLAAGGVLAGSGLSIFLLAPRTAAGAAWQAGVTGAW